MLYFTAKKIAAAVFPQTMAVRAARAQQKTEQNPLTLAHLQELASLPAKKTAAFDLLTLLPRVVLGGYSSAHTGPGKVVPPGAQGHAKATAPSWGLWPLASGAAAILISIAVTISACMLGVLVAFGLHSLVLAPKAIRAVFGQQALGGRAARWETKIIPSAASYSQQKIMAGAGHLIKALNFSVASAQTLTDAATEAAYRTLNVKLYGVQEAAAVPTASPASSMFEGKEKFA